MHLRLSIRTVLLVTGVLFSTASIAGSLEDDFMSTHFGLVPGVPIDYCSKTLPDLRADLAGAAQNFEVRVRKAASPFLKQLAAEGAKPNPIAEAELKEVRAKMLAEISKAEPRMYCTGLLSRLRSLNAEALVAESEQKYRKYLEAAKAQSEQGAK